MSFVLVGSTSGSITLQEPAVAGTTVLDFPAVSGTILTTTSPKAGNVIQVVSTTYATQTSTTSTSYVDSGLSLSITPSNSSNKILIMVNGTCDYSRTLTNIDTGFGVQLVRNSTSIYNHNLAFYLYINGASSNNDMYGQFSMSYVDSPSTTSSTTYKLQFRTYSGLVKIHADNYPSSITLMEIAG